GGQRKTLFRDVSAGAGLAPAQPFVSFGTRFADFDNDGWLDLFLANGHVLGPVEKVDPSLSYPQPMQLFRNQGNGILEEVSGQLPGDERPAPPVRARKSGSGRGDRRPLALREDDARAARGRGPRGGRTGNECGERPFIVARFSARSDLRPANAR